MNMAWSLPLAALALVIEALLGYPAPVYRAIGHPVTWLGAWLGWLEARLNKPAPPPERRRARGIAALALLLAPVLGLSAALTRLAPDNLAGFLLLALLASSLVAQRSLDAHVRAVANALERDGLPAARIAVGKIVGRDIHALDEAGVARAALESLAENFSDGIVAPLFWIALGGLVGGALYKAVNTADSMIGHKNPRYLDFGRAAARLDDWVNWPASRLSAVWLIGAAAILPGASASAAIEAVRRDAARHRSPNAGWPEAALAGALGLKLAGPRIYGDRPVDDAFMGNGRAELTARDIRRGLWLYRAACLLQALALWALAFTLPG
jgi:adenosylcobinamide-phosphate synthase